MTPFEARATIYDPDDEIHQEKVESDFAIHGIPFKNVVLGSDLTEVEAERRLQGFREATKVREITIVYSRTSETS